MFYFRYFGHLWPFETKIKPTETPKTTKNQISLAGMAENQRLQILFVDILVKNLFRSYTVFLDSPRHPPLLHCIFGINVSLGEGDPIGGRWFGWRIRGHSSIIIIVVVVVSIQAEIDGGNAAK